MEENKSKEVKYRNQSIFVWIVVIFLAYFLGQNIFADAGGIFGENSITYAILTIIGGYIFATIIYEIGKLLFGKIGGYHLVSINLFGLTFYKKQNKTKFKLSKFQNYGGKTIMAPNKERCCLDCYLLGGLIFSVFITILMLVFSHVIANQTGLDVLIYIEYIIASVTLIILIFNLAPFINDEYYDGFVLRIVNQNKEFKKIYNKMLSEEDALSSGRGELLFFENIDFSNPLYCKASLYNYYYLMANHKENEAELMVKTGLENKQYLSDEEIGLLNSMKYYFLFLRGNEEKVGEEFYTLEKSIRKTATSYHRFETIKTALLVAALVDSSFDLYEYILNRMDKEKERTSNLIVEVEEELINKSLKQIELKKVDWFREEENIEE